MLALVRSRLLKSTDRLFQKSENEVDFQEGTHSTGPGATGRTAGARGLSGIIDSVLHQPVFLSTNFRDILVKPSWYANKYIGDWHRVPRAISFYLQIFSIAFVFSVIAESFQFYSGTSEIRTLAPILSQIFFGTLLVYALLRPFRETVTLAGLLTVVLYVDATYILTEQIVLVPISYIDYITQLNLFKTEKDVYNTAVEACLSHDSFVYSLVRGNLEFFINDTHRYNSPMLESFILNWQWSYIVALPFTVIFGRFLTAKYNVHWLAGAALGFIAFVFALQGYEHVADQVTTSIANKSDCYERMVNEVVKEYRPELLSRQVKVLLNNQLPEPLPQFSVAPDKRDFVIATEVPGPELTKDQRKFIFGEYLPKLKSTYCGDQAEWRLVRAINYNLLWLGLDNNRQVTFADRTTPEDCDPKHQ